MWLAVAGLCAACGSSGEGAGSSASAAASTSGGASGEKAAAGGCPEGAYKRADPGFCIKLPDGYKEGPFEERPNAQYPKKLRFEGPSSRSIVVSWGAATAEYDRAVEGMKALSKPSKPEHKLIGAGELPGGKGYFYQMSYGNGIGQAEVLMKTGKTLMNCYINSKEEDMAAQLEACKTLSPL